MDNALDLHKNPLLTSGQVCSMLNITRQTLSNWSREDKIRRVQVAPGKFRYDETSIYEMLGMHSPRRYKTVIYGRHSSAVRVPGTRVSAQLERVSQWCEGNVLRVDKVYKDTAPAWVFDPQSRPGFSELLRDVMDRKIQNVVVESPAVVGVFTYRFFAEICRRTGTRFVIITPFSADADMVKEINAEFTESVSEVKRQTTGAAARGGSMENVS